MSFIIETFQLKNFKISLSTKRWGIITSIKQDDIEILYLNQETFFDITKNVRWWIPLLFPNAWPLKNEDIYKLSQHWFVRNSSFEIEKITDEIIILNLILEKKYKEIFPYDFGYKLILQVENNSLKITQFIKNTWDLDMPISPGFHPYFLVDNDLKKDIKMSFSDDNFYDIWSVWATKELLNPWIFEVDFWEYMLEFDYDKIFKYIWLWSEKWKDFLCIEPVYERENWLIDNPYILWVGESIEMSMKVRVVK